MHIWLAGRPVLTTALQKIIENSMYKSRGIFIKVSALKGWHQSKRFNS